MEKEKKVTNFFLWFFIFSYESGINFFFLNGPLTNILRASINQTLYIIQYMGEREFKL